MTIRDEVLASPDPYHRALALMLYRRVDRDALTVTMHFEDASTVTFHIRYEVMP